MAGTVALAAGNLPAIKNSNTSSWPGSSYGGVAPAGRIALNAQRPILINSVRMYAAGYGASRSCRIGINGAYSNWFTVGSASASASTGFVGISLLIANSTGSTTLTSYMQGNGRMYFARGNGGGTFTDGNGVTWNGNLEGDYTWIECPSAPGTPVLGVKSTQSMTVSWSAPSSNGGSAILGYRVQASKSAAFTSPIEVSTNATTLAATINSLEPGATYYVRVLARNAVTDAASTFSPASGSLVTTMLSGGKRRNSANTGWDAANVRRRNTANTGWDLATVKRRNAANNGWDAGV